MRSKRIRSDTGQLKPPELRLGERLFEKRTSIENAYSCNALGRFIGKLEMTLQWALHRCIATALRCSALHERGRKNFRAIKVVTLDWHFSNLPKPFDGFRIMHLSDLHVGIDEVATATALKQAFSCTADICVTTGDFFHRDRIGRSNTDRATEAQRIADHIQVPHYAVLGNHDHLNDVRILESMGIHVLLNEPVAIQRSDATIWICGIDDPRHYKTHDLIRARADLPTNAFSILLAHSTEVNRDAEALGFQFMLSGHTHGGQICLPGGRPIITHCRSPRRFALGVWNLGKLRGYTSPGTGGGPPAVRFNCPPVIAIHVLRRALPNEPQSAVP